MRRALLVGAILAVTAAATLPVWKPAAKRFKWVVVASNLYQDALRRLSLKDDQIGQPDYGSLPDSEIATYIDRINSVYQKYEEYGALTEDRIRGTHVLEVGPGETIGVALRLAAAGAAHVTAIDKFVPLQSSPFHQRLYRSLIAALPAEQQRNLSGAVDLHDTVRLDPKRLTYVSGEGVEDAGSRIAPNSVDIIVSNAVLEEVYDADRMFDALDRVLKPGGRQIHVIDLRDYGMFSKHGFHPLEFLTIPDAIYRYMVESTGQPNRHLVDYYRQKTAALGYQSETYVTWVLGRSERLPEYPAHLRYGRDYNDENLQLVRAIRPRLLSRYRQLSDEDLLTQSILLVARKPDQVPPVNRAARVDQ